MCQLAQMCTPSNKLFLGRIPLTRPKRQLDRLIRFSRFCTAGAAFSVYIAPLHSSPKFANPVTVGYGPPWDTWVPWTHPIHHPKRQLYRFGRFSGIHGRYSLPTTGKNGPLIANSHRRGELRRGGVNRLLRYRSTRSKD